MRKNRGGSSAEKHAECLLLAVFYAWRSDCAVSSGEKEIKKINLSITIGIIEKAENEKKSQILTIIFNCSTPNMYLINILLEDIQWIRIRC